MCVLAVAAAIAPVGGETTSRTPLTRRSRACGDYKVPRSSKATEAQQANIPQHTRCIATFGRIARTGESLVVYRCIESSMSEERFQIQALPYLFLGDGHCEAAFNKYKSIFGRFLVLLEERVLGHFAPKSCPQRQ
mgnify:CR=1 FL=1